MVLELWLLLLSKLQWVCVRASLHDIIIILRLWYIKIFILHHNALYMFVCMNSIYLEIIPVDVWETIFLCHSSHPSSRYQNNNAWKLSIRKLHICQEMYDINFLIYVNTCECCDILDLYCQGVGDWCDMKLSFAWVR